MYEHHIPVLLEQTIEGLNIKPSGTYVDATAGFGGHSTEILKHLDPSGHLYCIDRDPDAFEYCTAKFADNKNCDVINGKFSDIDKLLKPFEINGVDGILMDIGVSSFQFDTPERGFSYQGDNPLDMRMYKSGITAADIVNEYSTEQLTEILYRFGEERFANRIVSKIIETRSTTPITTTAQLAELVSAAYPAKARRDGHPARQTFQALRIAVNSELDELIQCIDKGFELLNVGGILAIITFHSLEDRIVKQSFAEFCKGCTCPPDFPICVCGKTPRAKKITGKPITAKPEELNENHRSRSAKLRIIEKL